MGCNFSNEELDRLLRTLQSNKEFNLIRAKLNSASGGGTCEGYVGVEKCLELRKAGMEN
jgi:hypothetical protein